MVKLLYTLRGVSELAEYDEAGVLEKYEVPASRYADFAILRGDPSDELPGVRGVGEKTARELVNAYGSLDELLDDADAKEPRPGPLKGKPALRARLRESRDYVDAMLRLVPVNAEAPRAPSTSRVRAPGGSVVVVVDVLVVVVVVVGMVVVVVVTARGPLTSVMVSRTRPSPVYGMTRSGSTFQPSSAKP